MQHSCSHDHAFRSITSQTCTYLRTWQHQMTTIMQPFQCDLPPLIQETHRTTHTGTTTRCRTQRRNQNDPSRTHRTHEVPFIAGCSHFTSKNARFRAPAASQNKVHATFMQPLHCVSQHHVANLHVSTHMATPDVTTIMQRFQCDLQPQIQETHRYTHTGTTTRCRTQRRNQNDPSRTRRTHEVPFIAGRSHLHRKTQGFVLRLPPQNKAPCNIHAAITLRFAAPRRKPARIYAHGNTVIWLCVRVPGCACARGLLVFPSARVPVDSSCARVPVDRPRARVPGGPLGDLSRGSPPATATSHGKTQGFVPRLPPQNKVHATFMQPLHCVSQHHVANLHVSMHMATPDDNNHAAITRGYCYVMSSPTPQSHTTLH